MADQPTPEQVKEALGSIDEGDQVRLTLKDGREVAGTLERSDGRERVADADGEAVEIAADQVERVRVLDETQGAE